MCSGKGTDRKAEFTLQPSGHTNRLTPKTSQDFANNRGQAEPHIEATRKLMNLDQHSLSEGRTSKQSVAVTLKNIGCLDNVVSHVDFGLPVRLVHHGLVPRQATVVTWICCNFCCL